MTTGMNPEPKALIKDYAYRFDHIKVYDCNMREIKIDKSAFNSSVYKLFFEMPMNNIKSVDPYTQNWRPDGNKDFRIYLKNPEYIWSDYYICAFDLIYYTFHFFVDAIGKKNRDLDAIALWHLKVWESQRGSGKNYQGIFKHE